MWFYLQPVDLVYVKKSNKVINYACISMDIQIKVFLFTTMQLLFITTLGM